MAMVCPQCSGAFDQHLMCPTCNVRLLYQANLGPSSAVESDSQWQQTPWGRLVVGLLLAQGLAHGLRLLATAGLMAGDDSAGQTVWSTLFGLVLWHALQGLSLLVGGAIAGAGQARGLVYGCVLGIINGLIFLAVGHGQGESLTPIALYGQPLLHLALGGLGGLIGTCIWKPLPTVSLASNKTPPPPTRSRSQWRAFAGPIAWVRVLAGCALVVGGSIWSQGILQFVLEASQGALTIRSHLQAQLVSWEITALATLCGAGLAGATTANGLKQGLCVGLGAGAVLLGIHLNSPQFVLETTVFTVASILCLTLAGGWFGGQLFPPLLAQRPRRRLHLY